MSEEKPKLTPEQEKAKLEEFNKRVKGFNDELIPLLGKYKLGLMGRPLILPNGTIAAEASLFDDTAKPKVEPKEPEPSAPIAA